MRKSGLTGDEAYILAKHGKTTEDLGPLKKEIGLIKEDLTSKADKTALAKTDRKLDALWKLNQGISYEFQTDDTEAYQKTVPSGAKMVSIKSIGGKTIVWNQLISDGAGELISAPVNEVVEQGRNLFDCYGFSCTSISNINAKRDIANDYGTTISTIDPTNRLIVTQNKADGSTQTDYRNGYFAIGIRGLKYNTNYILAFDFTPTKMLIVDPMIKLLVNGKVDSDNSASDFTLNVKKHVTIKFIYNANNDVQFLELRNSGMSGIFENFQIEEGTTVATYSPYHKTSYLIPQAILNLPGYGWSAGDARNEVNWENKKYIQRVGKYTIDGSEIIFKENKYWVMTVTDFEKPRPSTKNAICVNFKVTDTYSKEWGGIIFRTESNGFVFTDSESKFANADEVKDYFQQNNETIYYEINEEQIIDISDIIDNTFQEPIEVEAGGTLTFRNSHGDDYRIPVPNSEEYVISLAEVAK